MFPILTLITLAYHIFNFYTEKFLILVYFEKSEDIDGLFLRQVVRSFFSYIFIFPIFLSLLLIRFVGIPLFVFSGFSILLIIVGLIMFRFVDRQVKSFRLMEKTTSLRDIPLLTDYHNEYINPVISKKESLLNLTNRTSSIQEEEL